MNYDDHTWCLKALKKAQDADHDLREQAREAAAFIDKRQGMWEDDFANATKDRPQYVFDIVSPVIDQINGDIAGQNFSLDIQPMSSEADEDTAETYDGLIRAIHNISDAERKYNAATELCVKTGFSALRLKQEYVDGDSFDQDLLVDDIPNALDRVWFGPHTEPTAADCDYCWVMAGIDKEVFKLKYPKRELTPLHSDRSETTYFYKNDDIVMMGEFIYLEEETRTLHKMTDGAVYDAEKVKELTDELAASGIEVEATREVKVKCAYSRLFDANGWITEPRKTVFKHHIPVVPVYGNFAYDEEKVIYRGAVERLMDSQRVFNYSLSREIEEGALAPRKKLMMTEAMALGYEDTLGTMNTNTHPVQFINADPNMPNGPQETGGPQINPGLRVISEAMQGLVNASAGMFAANMGDAVTGNQSGKAIEALQDKGERGNNKYLNARITAQEQIARLLIDAIPEVYGPKRQIRIIGEDGTQDIVTIGKLAQDQQTGGLKTVRDLSKGKYSVRCRAAPSFESRQSETVSSMVEIGQVDPSVIQLGGDILFGNIPAPGMDEIAARKRQMLFQQGAIPQDQMTEEELNQLQAMQNQPPQEDPNMVLARAEEAKAQADAMAVQQKLQESQQSHEVKIGELQIKERELQVREFEAMIKAQEAGVNMDHKIAATAKLISEAQAQELENDEVVRNVTEFISRAAREIPEQPPTEPSPMGPDEGALAGNGV